MNKRFESSSTIAYRSAEFLQLCIIKPPCVKNGKFSAILKNNLGKLTNLLLLAGADTGLTPELQTDSEMENRGL